MIDETCDYCGGPIDWCECRDCALDNAFILYGDPRKAPPQGVTYYKRPPRKDRPWIKPPATRSA